MARNGIAYADNAGKGMHELYFNNDIIRELYAPALFLPEIYHWEIPAKTVAVPHFEDGDAVLYGAIALFGCLLQGGDRKTFHKAVPAVCDLFP